MKSASGTGRPARTGEGRRSSRAVGPSAGPQPAKAGPFGPGGKRVVVGISGASGAQYATRLLEQLLVLGHEVHLVVTEYGRQLLHDELNITRLNVAELTPSLAAHAAEIENKRLFVHPHKDVGAVIASGSFLHDGMVVVPCSSTALGYIATGSGSNLLGRAAMVTLKERRKLILVHRESPLSYIDIKNMEAVTLAGGIIAPANPGFYLLPKSLDEIIDFVVAKCLDLLEIKHDLKNRWAHRKAEMKRSGHPEPRA
ncbi:MAG: UbiX family flavin prenyltransferase [Phycisphaerales bacterium]|jgi:4-hydroxy-3-polyprenylbenzoate decarboxylase|nr:UbiX family flavin prenyltransferase [Phycisphaerales bacterium]